jgi:hypothetical protein
VIAVSDADPCRAKDVGLDAESVVSTDAVEWMVFSNRGLSLLVVAGGGTDWDRFFRSSTSC